MRMGGNTWNQIWNSSPCFLSSSSALSFVTVGSPCFFCFLLFFFSSVNASSQDLEHEARQFNNGEKPKSVSLCWINHTKRSPEIKVNIEKRSISNMQTTTADTIGRFAVGMFQFRVLQNETKTLRSINRRKDETSRFDQRPK